MCAYYRTGEILGGQTIDDSAREFISGAGERTSASAAAAAETTAAAAAKAVAETADANAHAGRAAAEQTTTRYKWILRVA